MATKLKNLRMTSVDLVRNGANQAADICLYKSADPTDDPTMPTAEETNVLKRFFARLFATATEAAVEPDDPIEKADEEPCLADIYKSAITESLQSIAADDTLTEAEKNDMIAKSMDQYHDAMLDLFGFGPEEEPLQKSDDDDDLDDWEWEDDDEEEDVEKINHNHDALGRFASSPGGGGGGASAADAKRTKYHNQCKRLASHAGSRKMSGTITPKKVKEAIGRGGTLREFEGKAYFLSPQEGGITAYTGKKTKNGGIDVEQYITGVRTIEDAQMWSVGTILNSVSKSADIDEIEEV